MAGLFNSSPIRSNGQVDVSWWNSLRAAGAFLENMLGGGIAVETQFTVANNTGPSSVTGLVFDKASYRSVRIEYTMMRKTDTAASGRREQGRLICNYEVQDDAWTVDHIVDGTGANGPAGVTFTITSGGQLQYTSDDLTGANYVGKMRHKVASTFSVET